jgi:hypothetical protein
MNRDDERYRQFFLNPTETSQRQYEAIRAFFIEKRRVQEIAQQFGYQESSLRSMISRFRADVQNKVLNPFLFSHGSDARQSRLTRTRRPRPRFPKSLTVEG